MDWLAFSLSNQQHPCFFDSFNPSSAHHGGSVDQRDDEVGGSGGGGSGSASDLGMLDGVGPKLEDFLGGCGEPMGRYTGESSAPEHDGGGGGMYDSDLKTIAAGFMRGFPASDQDGGGGIDNSKAVVVPSAAAVVAEPKKAVDTFGQRTSIYRGVTRHRWTGRYEAHLWDNSCRREGQSRKGRQVYLGGYDKEEKAARAYDLAALKYWGPTTTTNFPVSNYEKELEEMKNMTRQEFVASLRRKSSGFSRGASIYRGVTRHHQHGRWQARIGRVAGNKDLYLGTFSTQEEAAEAYDIAAIKFRGLNAVTNFDMSRYDVKSIASSNLPIGGMSGGGGGGNRSNSSKQQQHHSDTSPSSSSDTKGHNLDLSSAAAAASLGYDYWSMLALHHHQQQQQQQQQTPYFNVFPSGGVNMDFTNATTVTTTAAAQESGSYVWSIGGGNGGMVEQSQSSSSCSIPYATPIALGSGYDATTSTTSTSNAVANSVIGTSYGSSWVTPSGSAMHPYHHQPPPIFGIE